MKSILLSIVLLAGCAIFLSGCEKEISNPDSLAGEELYLKNLKGTWVQSDFPTMDGSPRIDFNNLELTLEGEYAQDGFVYNYYFSDDTLFPDNSIWPDATAESKGEWKFNPGSEENSIIRLEDDVVMTYTLDENKLTLQFDCTTCPGYPITSRTKSVSGVWIFTFVKV